MIAGKFSNEAGTLAAGAQGGPRRHSAFRAVARTEIVLAKLIA